MSNKQIHLVVLDIAGTTVRDDDAVNRCVREALFHGGVKVSREDVNEVMGYPKPVAIRCLLENRRTGQTVSSDEITRLHEDFLRRMVRFYQSDASVEPAMHATEVLADLRDAGIAVALDTGFSREIVKIILDRLGWEDSQLVNYTVASDEVAHGRPHPDLIFRAMELAGVKHANQVAKVGDTPADLQEGHAAQCALVVGVTNGTHTREQLASFPHTHLIGTLRELVPLVVRR